MIAKPVIQIDVKLQKLFLHTAAFQSEYSISTAKAGVGETKNSACTPTGLFKIRKKIGDNLPINSVFVGRRPTGEIYTRDLANQYPQRDWILTRIIWLTGCQSGINRGGDVDTLRRYIYIHGTPDSEPMGIPLSHGCIRMRNTDLIELYVHINEKDLIEIKKP